MAALPFTTYFPAIIVAALIGGAGPGLATAMLVSVIAWYPTIPNELGPQAGIWLVLLVCVTAVNVIVVGLLAAAFEPSTDRKSEREPAE